jgi:DNA polymerase III subunit gamma/tau
MAYQVLARKYRPQRFADVAGQEHVTRTLLNALEQGRIAHGYIFSGHRGIGKTTIARILAMSLNCRTAVGTPERPNPEPCGVCDNCREISAASRAEVSPFEESHSFDVEEIDAATHRGIDDAKLLISKIQGRPTNKSKYRILILDEAHQITDAAWNALLKTLEEPPPWAVFMFATTQPEDIPQTIRSRCQHFSFHAVKYDDILAQLGTIAKREEINVEDGALALLAEAGDGSMRDALSIMDQAIASAPVTGGRPHLAAEAIRELMGSVPNTVFERLMEAISAQQTATVIEEINTLMNAGNSPASLARQFVRYLRNTLMARIGGENSDLLQISADERARASRSAMLFSEEDLTRFLQVMLRTFDDLNYRQEQRFHLELGLVKLVHLQRLLPVEELLSQVPSAPPGTGSRVQGAAGNAPAPPTRTAAPAVAPPRPSPFEADRERKTVGDGPASGTGSTPTPRALSPVESVARITAEAKPPAAVSIGETVGESSEGAPALAPEAANGAPPDLDRIRNAVCAALDNEGHNTAAAQILNGDWKENGSTIQVELPLRKAMLALTVNAEAEAICKKAMRAIGATQKLTFTPSENGAAGAAKAPAKVAAPASGSVHSAALENPLVRRTQELFKAEIRSVLDLRDQN